jgi:fumarate reductase subunit C
MKTLPTLVTGDSFTNVANIYFDYNFPILTNKATSTFKTLGTQDFEFADYFSVYPNPVNDILNIVTKNTIQLNAIAVYDMLGQIVIAVPNAQNISKVNVSKLPIGNYFLKMITDKGTSSFKFTKK